MRSDTQTVTIDARPKDVLAFVGDGQNLPRWAIGFARSVRAGQGGWLVGTGGGEVLTTIQVEESAGTVDFRMQPEADVEITAYGRAVPNGEGTEFVFTQHQHPGTPDNVFDQAVAAVRHELITLKAVLEVECPL